MALLTMLLLSPLLPQLPHAMLASLVIVGRSTLSSALKMLTEPEGASAGG
jgi:hypothetical protein